MTDLDLDDWAKANPALYLYVHFETVRDILADDLGEGHTMFDLHEKVDTA